MAIPLDLIHIDLMRLSRADRHVDRFADILYNMQKTGDKELRYTRRDIERMIVNLTGDFLAKRGEELFNAAMDESPIGLLNACIRIMPREERIEVTSNIVKKLVEGRERARRARQAQAEDVEDGEIIEEDNGR